MSTISIFEEYMGEKIDKSCVDRLMNGPDEHISGLLERLARYYYDWLENEEKAAEEGDIKKTLAEDRRHTYFCIDPLRYRQDWREKIDTYKKYLLYFPNFAIPDPVAEFLWPYISMARLFGAINADERFHKGLREALLTLVEMAPAFKKNDVVLMPLTFASDYTSVNQAVNSELQAIKQYDDYWNPLHKVAEKYDTDASGLESAVADTKRECQLCSRLEYTPIAGHELTYSILRQDYKQVPDQLKSSNIQHRVTQTLLQYDVPGLENANLELVFALRNNEDAFYEWRRDFGKVLDAAQSEQPTDDNQFEREFRAAADGILTPRMNELKKATASSVLEKFLVPSALTLGAGAAAFHVGHLPEFPATTIATAALGGPASWIVDRIIKQYNKGGRKATILRELYGYLLVRGT